MCEFQKNWIKKRKFFNGPLKTSVAHGTMSSGAARAHIGFMRQSPKAYDSIPVPDGSISSIGVPNFYRMITQFNLIWISSYIIRGWWAQHILTTRPYPSPLHPYRTSLQSVGASHTPRVEKFRIPHAPRSCGSVACLPCIHTTQYVCVNGCVNVRSWRPHLSLGTCPHFTLQCCFVVRCVV